MTKKEIVKQISIELDEPQVKTKEIVQLTFEAIVKTLLEEKRIELRNFGVFEVKRRKARKARNPRTGQKVDVPPKNVVTFKPGKAMEEAVRLLTDVPDLEEEEKVEAEPEAVAVESNGVVEEAAEEVVVKPKKKSKKKPAVAS